VLPYERLEVYWLAEEFVAYVDYLMPRLRKKNRTDALQLDRAAGSIVNNICEGSADRPPKERIRFFSYSRRSVSECDTAFQRFHRNRTITDSERRITYSYADRLSAMLYNLIRGQ
jgi:four helix bundle protein